MPEMLIKYNDKDQRKVDSYNELDDDDKCGSYWNNEKDVELKNLKKSIKEHYIHIQGFVCPYCKQKNVVEHNGVWDAEHIIPKDEFPQFMFSPLNLCVSCKDCNQSKSNKSVLKNRNRKTLPLNKEDYTIIHPHLDNYHQHIKILNSSLFFIPLDSKGKETIEVCGLLRFLYNFVDYGNVSVEVKKRIGVLHQELVSASTSIEENFILSCIGDVVEHGKQLAQKEHIKNLCV